jgi:putative addiction module component (TIGR02574 family)
MSVSFAVVEQQATALLPDERARLAEILLESLHNDSVAEIEAEWQQEIAQRAALYDRGEAECFPAEQIFAEAMLLSK